MGMRKEVKQKHSTAINVFKSGLYAAVFLSVWIIIIFYLFPNTSLTRAALLRVNAAKSRCPGDTGRVFVYDLPDKFNAGLLARCRTLNMFVDMCPHVANGGLGGNIRSLAGGDGGWFATNQFFSEVIFHARVERHPCRTYDATEAELFYVPFYSGLWTSSVIRQSDFNERNKLGDEFVELLVRLPPWRRHRGADHFIATGRTAWDLMRREAGNSSFGGNHLFLLPAVRNMTVLTVERHPWHGDNQFGFPYPSYFHPSTPEEVSAWQEVVRRSNRTHLFSFVGGPRRGTDMATPRNESLRQCGESSRCLRAECKGAAKLCHQPTHVLGLMMSADFCLQPPGDSYTRRSVFDSFLAGCVPVFFSPHTAYTQYQWYLPEPPTDYSVLLEKDKWGDIQGELQKIPAAEVRRMRQRIVDFIPSLTYAHPNATHPGFRDAVDVALAHLTRRVRARLSAEQASTYV